MPGELWIGGEALTFSSHHRLDLTREKFLDNPFGHARLAIAVLISLSNAQSSFTVERRRKSRSEGVSQSTALEMIIIGERRGDCASIRGRSSQTFRNLSEQQQRVRKVLFISWVNRIID
jgi:hypothetical protein